MYFIFLNDEIKHHHIFIIRNHLLLDYSESSSIFIFQLLSPTSNSVFATDSTRRAVIALRCVGGKQKLQGLKSIKSVSGIFILS